MHQSSVSLTRAKIRRTLKLRKGAMAQLARDLGISKATVSGVLRGKGDSARVLVAAEAKAVEILASEAAQ